MLLLEVKDTSEIMIDLAYSSLIFNDKEIADEVSLLRDYVDDLVDGLQSIVLERASHDKNFDRAITFINLARSMENIADAADAIADVVERQLAVHPVLAQSILESDTAIAKEQVGPRSVLAGRMLKDLRLATDTGWFVIVLKRGDRWIIGPDGQTVVEPGDVLFARGPLESRGHLCRLAKGKTKKIQFLPKPRGPPDVTC
jgi:uncharacterized protein with PhoU and TrkA domain